MHLGVNIDHVATLRQARYATMLDSHNVEPDIVAAAKAAQAGGADSITLHVREDRRHMQDADAFAVRREVNLPLNLEMGADDYVEKPFDLKELSARVKAVLRRTRTHVAEDEGDVIKFENFEISQDRFELKLRGKKVDIPPKELQLLYCLASNPNRVFSRELLLEHVWDFAFLGDSRTVDVHIKRLREKLEGVSDKWALKTVWGIGYKFELYN